MKIADEIREIINEVVNKGGLNGKSQKDYDEVIDQALKEILKLKVKLPNKREYELDNDIESCGNAGDIRYYGNCEGYNQALSVVTELNDE